MRLRVSHTLLARLWQRTRSLWVPDGQPVMACKPLLPHSATLFHSAGSSSKRRLFLDDSSWRSGSTSIAADASPLGFSARAWDEPTNIFDSLPASLLLGGWWSLSVSSREDAQASPTSCQPVLHCCVYTLSPGGAAGDSRTRASPCRRAPCRPRASPILHAGELQDVLQGGIRQLGKGGVAGCSHVRSIAQSGYINQGQAASDSDGLCSPRGGLCCLTAPLRCPLRLMPLACNAWG